MREIKFRGIDKRGVWHYGYLWESPDGCFHIKERISKTHYADFEVIKKSIGRFTGLKDKNGRGIWEGDVVRFEGPIGHIDSEVIWEDGSFWIIDLKPVDFGDRDLEVIGNIYENTELLEPSK